MKKIIILISIMIFANKNFAQTQQSAQQTIEKCYNAGLNFEYDTVKQCLSKRNAQYVDIAKEKLEKPSMMLKKGMLMFMLKTITYEIVDEKNNENSTKTMKIKANLLNNPVYINIVMINEDNCWKIDDIPNSKEILDQIPEIKQFTK